VTGIAKSVRFQFRFFDAATGGDQVDGTVTASGTDKNLGVLNFFSSSPVMIGVIANGSSSTGANHGVYNFHLLRRK